MLSFLHIQKIRNGPAYGRQRIPSFFEFYKNDKINKEWRTIMLNYLWNNRDVESRSISAENPDGEKGKGGMATEGCNAGCARELGQGWKVNPFSSVPANTEKVIADIKGSGMIKHIWFVPFYENNVRTLIIRFYWDDDSEPAVECPLDDFFASANKEYWQLSSIAICRNPKNGMNCYWEMPFKKSCRITLENITSRDLGIAFQIDYDLCKVPDDALYFHAQFRRSNPTPYKQNFTILDNITGKGCYVGTYMNYGIFNNGWWGEGEIKFFLDGDGEFPTICGTGTEDYFCGSYNFDYDGYKSFSGPYTGFYVWETDKTYVTTKRFSLYRWHISDAVHFSKDIRTEIQVLGWRSEGRYLPLQCDIAAVAYFYLDRTHCSRPEVLSKDELEII